MKDMLPLTIKIYGIMKTRKTSLVLILAVSAMVLFAFSGNSQTIKTIAGTGAWGSIGDGGPATAAEFLDIFGVTTDRTGNVYIVDDGNNNVRIVNSSGIVNAFAGNGTIGFSGDGGPATAAELWYPQNAAVDKAGNVYIADSRNNRVRMVNTSGIISTFAGNGTGSFSGDGGPATAAELYGPYGVAIDGAGNIYIADYSNNRVRIVNPAGIINTFAGNGLTNFSGDGGPATAAEIGPIAVATDNNGNVYIADEANDRIRMVHISGIINTIAGNGALSFSGDGGLATAAEINGPDGVATDLAGNIYIADNQNNRIRMVNSSGIINTLAGSGTGGFSGDGGPASAAELKYPWAIATDASGNLYFADYGNDRIRKITMPDAGINDLKAESEGWKVIPDPNSGIFTLQLSSSSQPGISDNNILEIYNMQGQKIYSNSFKLPATSININLSSQPVGIYLYRIITASGGLDGEGRFIIQK